MQSLDANGLNLFRDISVDFSEPVSKYTSHCSAHFEDECYERRYSSLLGEGSGIKSVLKKGSILTKAPVVPKGSNVTTEQQKRKVIYRVIE